MKNNLVINRYISRFFPKIRIEIGKSEAGWDIDNFCRYKTLTSGGIKKEGDEYPTEAFVPTAKSAWRCYIVELNKWLNCYKTGGILYWRKMPEISKPKGRYVISSRLDIVSLSGEYILGENGEDWK